MMILEKRREIGILMSMGARSGAVMRIFMFNGIIVGFLGSTLGVLFGVVVCFIQYKCHLIPLPGDLYFINKVPVIIQPLDVLAVYIAANMICWLQRFILHGELQNFFLQNQFDMSNWSKITVSILDK